MLRRTLEAAAPLDDDDDDDYYVTLYLYAWNMYPLSRSNRLDVHCLKWQIHNRNRAKHTLHRDMHERLLQIIDKGGKGK